MAQENSADDLEVARILRMLPHLVWEAQHPRRCTHNLRWGETKMRSAGNDEARPPPTHSPAAAPTPPRPPPPHHTAAPPPAVEKPIKKRGGHPTKRCPAATALEEAAAAAAAVPAGRCSNHAATETSSPETPLEFCLSSEEPDAKANPGPPVEGQTPTKKPKSNHREPAGQTSRHANPYYKNRAAKVGGGALSLSSSSSSSAARAAATAATVPGELASNVHRPIVSRRSRLRSGAPSQPASPGPAAVSLAQSMGARFSPCPTAYAALTG